MAGDSTPDDMELQLEHLLNAEYGSLPESQAQLEPSQKRQRLRGDQLHLV